jgi:hypothetical protein
VGAPLPPDPGAHRGTPLQFRQVRTLLGKAGAPKRLSVEITELEDDLQRYLSNPRICGRSKSRKVPVADRGKVVDCAFVAQEIHVVEDIKVFAAQLQLEAFGDSESLREPHVPAVKAWESQAPFSHVAECVFDGRIAGHFECGRIEPLPTGRCCGAGPGTVWVDSCERRAVLANSGARNVRTLRDRDWPAGLRLHETAQRICGVIRQTAGILNLEWRSYEKR